MNAALPTPPDAGARRAAPPAVSPQPTPLEAAAIAAAIERFARDTAAPTLRRQPTAAGWLRAARLEAVGRAPQLPGGGADWHPWRERLRRHNPKP